MIVVAINWIVIEVARVLFSVTRTNQTLCIYDTWPAQWAATIREE